MISPVSSIIRQSVRKPLEPLNILSFCTHERADSCLALTGNNFYMYMADGIKTWETNYASVPENVILLDGSKGVEQIPNHIDLDLILSQQKFGQYQIAHQLAKSMHVNIVSLEHTLPFPHWPPQQRKRLRDMKGCVNAFITKFSVSEWGFELDDPTVRVIPHMVDADIFKPNEEIQRQPYILSIANDYIDRDWCLNFSGWQRITKGLPVRLRGNTPGLSTATTSIEELVSEYQNAQVFLNTSTISPLPTVLLEAMACGCAVISTATCEIPNIIQHGKNGLISNNEDELREYCNMLLNNPDLCKELGENARKTTLSSFSKENFINSWQNVFKKAANTPYLGV